METSGAGFIVFAKAKAEGIVYGGSVAGIGGCTGRGEKGSGLEMTMVEQRDAVVFHLLLRVAIVVVWIVYGRII